MFNNSLDAKPLFTRPDGQIVRDITQTMFELKNRNYTSYNVYKVPKDYIMRPDLISQSVYNNSLYAEIILKFNGISNPFTINEGDVILIPDFDSAKDKIKTTNSGDGESQAERIRKSYKYIDPLKNPTNKVNVNKFNNRNLNNISSAADGDLPPNITKEGDSPITYKSGRVYFGSGAEVNGQSSGSDSINILAGKNCLKNGMTNSEFLTNVIKGK